MADAQQSPESFVEELAQLRATLAAQQAELATQRATIAQQQTAIAALQQGSDATEAAGASTLDGDALTEAPPHKTSRRSLLVGAAGVAAAGAAAAAVVALSEPPVAHAANNGAAVNNAAHTANTTNVANATGSPLVLGNANDANATTILSNTSGSAPSPVLMVQANEFGSYATAIYAEAFANAGAAPGAKSGAKKGNGGLPIGAVIAGFPGQGAGNAVPGNGTGGGAGGAAITAISDIGVGVDARSFGNVDLVMDGTGRMMQIPFIASGPPTGTATIFNQGESIRDGNGDLWLCIVGGAPGTWVKVATLSPGLPGGATSYLAKPIRLFDSRPGQPAASNPGHQLLPNTSTKVSVAGVTYNTVTVPSPLAGAIGNVTVLNASGGAFVEIVPSGAGFTGASTTNIGGPGQIVANGFNVALSGGALDIYVAGVAVDVIIDLFAIVS